MSLSILRSIAVSSGLLLSTCIQASVFSHDLNSPSDGLLTRDSEQKLEFLDLSLTTQYKSIDTIMSEGQWQRHGFRFATKNEVETLVVNAGVTLEWSIENRNPITDLKALLTDSWTLSSDDQNWLHAFYFEGNNQGGQLDLYMSVGESSNDPGSGQAGFKEYPLDTSVFNYPHASADRAAGVFLVRDYSRVEPIKNNRLLQFQAGWFPNKYDGEETLSCTKTCESWTGASTEQQQSLVTNRENSSVCKVTDNEAALTNPSLAQDSGWAYGTQSDDKTRCSAPSSYGFTKRYKNYMCLCIIGEGWNKILDY